jgi:hypothetical protein
MFGQSFFRKRTRSLGKWVSWAVKLAEEGSDEPLKNGEKKK